MGISLLGAQHIRKGQAVRIWRPRKYLASPVAFAGTKFRVLRQWQRDLCPLRTMVFGFWFLVFVYNTASPVVGTLLPAKTWAESHSTLCFHRDSKVSIDSIERMHNK